MWSLIDCIPDSDTDELASIVRDVRADAVREMLAAIREARGTDCVSFEALGAALWRSAGLTKRHG